MRVTPFGFRLLDGADDHPLLPDFVEQLRVRVPGLPTELIELLVDAHECFERSMTLNRACVALLGFAYEHAIEHVLESLITAALAVQPPRSNASTRLNAVRDAIERKFPGRTGAMLERQNAAVIACDFANYLRTRRNDASHSNRMFGFEDRQEAEELLASAGRNLPGLWAMA